MDKIEPIYPKSSAEVSLKVDGIFSFPDEWRTTDEANPGLFTYVVKFCNLELTGGKVYARELTEKQLREQEEAKKKGGKKEAKKQENPAEAEKLKEQQEKQEAEQRRRQEAWSKMTEEQRIYATSEDKHKSGQLRFENNTVEKQFKDNLLVVFEEHVLKDGGEWVYIFKQPTANEQQLDKLKKSKPKNLNINDLNAVSMRAWVDLTSLRSSEHKQCSLRCKIQQVDATEQTPKPNLQKSYIKLSVTLSQPLLAATDPHSTSTLIKDPPQPSPIPLSKKCVLQMHQQLRLAIQSLAMEYSNMFWKQLNANEEQRAALIFVTNKKNEHVKRKEQFLYDFNVSGKYKVLKERLKKIIVHLCQHKFTDKMQGAKSFTGITCSVRDQFYSEIYNYLVTFYSETMEQLIAEKKQKLQEVFVLNNETHNSLTQQVLQQYRKETKQQRFSRIIGEYNAVGNFEYGQNMYKTDIARNPQNSALKYQYSMFCIRNGFNTVSEVLGWGFIEQYLESNKKDDSVRVEYVLLLIGSENPKLLKKAWVILREIINEHPTNNVYLLYASLLSDLLGKTQCASKYSFLAYRQQLRKDGKIKEEGRHRTEPNASQLPSLTAVARYNQQMKAEQKDKLWIQVIQDFSQLGLFNIIEKLKQKLSSEQIPSIVKQNVKILYSQQQYKECKEKAIHLYNTSKDYELLLIILRCCQNLGDNEEREKYLKVSLQSAGPDKKKQALLALGQFYIGAGKYGNAKACLVKYLEGNSAVGGLSWQILGIAQLKCGNYTVAIQCLRHSNLSDPYNKQVWIWLAEAYSKLNNFVMVNQCLNCYLDSPLPSQGKAQLRQVKQCVQAAKTANFYDNSMKQKLLARLECY